MTGLSSEQDRVKAARRVLDAIWQGKFDKPWLVVYDNVEKPGDIERLTPRGGAHILITTRWPHWDDTREISVDVFPKDVAVAYLMKRARKNDVPGAARLAEALGYLPLALDHAGSYCIGAHSTFDEYHAQLADFLRRKPKKGASAGQYPESAWGTFNIALDSVIGGDQARGVTAVPEAERLMRMLAFMAPDQFPLDVISTWQMSDIEKGEAVAALEEKALIRTGAFEDGQRSATIHRLVQVVMRGRLEAADELESAVQEAEELVALQFNVPTTFAEVKKIERLAPHAIAVLSHSPTEGSGNWTNSYLAARVGDWLRSRGSRAAALAYYQQSLTFRESRAAANPDNFDAQESLSYILRRIASVKEALGDTRGALADCEHSLDISGRLAKADPANTEWQQNLASSLSAISSLKQAMGDLASGLAYSERSLVIRERLAKSNPDNTDWQESLSHGLNQHANARVSIGDRAGALPLYERCIVIRERLAKSDPDNTDWQESLAICLKKSGDALLATGWVKEARDFHQRRQAIYQALSAKDPGHAGWMADWAMGFFLLAMDDALAATGPKKAAVAIFRGYDALAVAGDASSVPSRCALIGKLFALAPTTPGLRADLARALELLRKLKEEDRLEAYQEPWIRIVEAAEASAMIGRNRSRRGPFAWFFARKRLSN